MKISRRGKIALPRHPWVAGVIEGAYFSSKPFSSVVTGVGSIFLRLFGAFISVCSRSDSEVMAESLLPRVFADVAEIDGVPALAMGVCGGVVSGKTPPELVFVCWAAVPDTLAALVAIGWLGGGNGWVIEEDAELVRGGLDGRAGKGDKDVMVGLEICLEKELG